jgi:hypothetical protein
MGLLADGDPVKTKIIDATLFKNGTAVTVHQAEIGASGVVLIEEPPLAALGTLWIYGHGGSKISEVVMTKWSKESESKVGFGSVAEALAINVGKPMTIRWFDNKEWIDIEGKLISVTNQLAVIEQKSTGMNLFVPISSIGSFKGGGELQWTRVVKSVDERPVLRIKGTPGSKVNLMGLQSGMTWVPAYQVDLTDEKKLKIVAKATVVNDLGDVSGIEARLVTGFPNLTMLGQWDPLTYVHAMMGRGGAPGGGGMAPAAAMQNSAGMRREAMDAGGAFESFEPQVGEGFSGEDLFFMPLKNLTLKRGERSYSVLFQTDSEYRHLYTLALPASGAQGGDRDYTPADLTVWHELEFSNTMKMPWTTGTALIVKGGEMLGQDELKYTTPGTKAYLKIAKGLDVSAEMREEEIERERGALKDRYNNPTFDLVTVKGTLVLTNYKGQDIEMKISKQFEGEALSTGNADNVFKSAKRLNQVNPTTAVEWRPSLKKGEKKVIEYTYKVYVTAR